MSTVLACACAPCAVLAARRCCSRLAPSGAGAGVYPRLGLYGPSVTATATLLWTPPGRSTTRDRRAVARYDEVILDASPITEYRPDVLGRDPQRATPASSVLAYVIGQNIW